MKPTDVVVDNMKIITPEVSQPPVSKIHVFGAKTRKAIFALLAVVVLLAIGVTIVTVYTTLKKPKETIQEKWVTLKNGDETTQEKMTRYNSFEEGFFVPDEYQAIIDYKRNLLFVKLISDTNKPCLVTPFNRTMLPDKDLLDSVFTGDTESVDIDSDAKVTISVTNIQASHNVLSETGKVMCAGRISMWAIPSYRDRLENGTSVARPKRGFCFRICYYFICYRHCW